MIRTNNNKDIFERMANDFLKGGSSYIREDSHWGSDLDIIKTSIDDLLLRKKYIRWLDVGCGPGFHLTSIAELYPEIEAFGIDYSPLMLKEAKTRIEKLGLNNITLEESNITEYTPIDKCHLITFLNNGLGNLCKNGTDPKIIRKKTIQKLVNILYTNGYLILSAYNREKLNPKYGSNLKLLKNLSDLENGDLFIEWVPSKNKEKTIYYSHWFSEKELYELAKKSGLKIDFIERRMSRFLVRYKNL